ncbi:hypothetical protein MLPF_2768 [Mycobacterium lepromatosis]|nr:hypothetical protein MLPF_2768 [Mycobacterium lepromatosis]
MHSKLDEAITLAIGAGVGARQEFPGMSGSELSQLTVMSESVDHLPGFYIGTFVACLV